ncbi:hypothetical protein Tco_0123376 [Tanacetum coccineum]
MINEHDKILMVDVKVLEIVCHVGLDGGDEDGEWEEEKRNDDEMEEVRVEDCDCLIEETMDGGGSHSTSIVTSWTTLQSSSLNDLRVLERRPKVVSGTSTKINELISVKKLNLSSASLVVFHDGDYLFDKAGDSEKIKAYKKGDSEKTVVD